MKEFKPTFGVEGKVTLNPHNKDQVVKKFHQEAPSIQYVKGRHYLMKILGLIFKENLPQIGRSFATAERPNEIEIERKDWDKDHRKMQKFQEIFLRDYLKDFETIDFPVITSIRHNRLNKRINKNPKRIEFLKRIRVILGDRTNRDVDLSHHYTKDKDGNPIYLDSLEPWTYNEDQSPQRLAFDSVTLEEEINKLPEEKRKGALFALKRLMALWNEEQANFAKDKNPPQL